MVESCQQLAEEGQLLHVARGGHLCAVRMAGLVDILTLQGLAYDLE